MNKSYLKYPLVLGLTFGMVLPVFNGQTYAITEEAPKIAGGFHHTLASKYDGEAYSWGVNNYGQLGIGNKQTKYVREFVNLPDAKTVATGKYHSIGVKNDGTVWAWGQNSSGKLGDGTVTTRLAPVKVKDLTDVNMVSAGDNHSLALKNDGTVYAWGSGTSGVLGDNTTVAKKTPIQVHNLDDVIAISAGTRHNLALKSDGTVYAWGLNNVGQLGDGTKLTAMVPVKVKIDNVVAIVAGNGFSLAVKEDGTVWAWGQNNYGRLGDGTSITRIEPVQVKNLTDVKDVAVGMYHAVALKKDGTVWAWGQNTYYQLGDNTKVNRYAPVQVLGLTDVYMIGAGANHSMAVKENGYVYGWGQNSYGKLGTGNTIVTKVPVLVKGLNIMKPNPELDESEIDPVIDEPVEEEVDETPPSTESNIPVAWLTGGFEVILTATDEESEIENTFYSVNNSPELAGNTFTVNEKGINKVSFYSVDTEGNAEEKKTVDLKIDDVAPVTSSDVKSGLYNADVTVNLSAVDHESGVEKTFYSIDGSSYVEGNQLTISEEGISTVYYYSEDIAGNKEEVKVLNITLDETAPVTVSNINGGVFNTDVNVKLSVTDNFGMGQTFYSIDGSSVLEGNDFIVTEEGTHQIAFYSVDKAGNKEMVKTFEITIDKTAPATQSNIEDKWSKEDVNVLLTSKDELTKVAKTFYSVNGSEYVEGKEFTVSEEGIHTVSFYSVDEAGNTENPTYQTVKIDKTNPITTVELSEDWYNKEATIQLLASDELSKVAKTFYSINGSEYAEGNNITLNHEGIHTVSYYTVDNAGNVEEVKSATVKLDKTAPTTSANTNDIWNKEDVEVQLVATDEGSKVAKTFYSFDGINYVEGNNFIVSEEGIHTIYFYSVDNAGNVETAKTTIVKVDKTLPVITMELAKEYALSGKVVLQYQATDALSGIASEVLTINDQIVANGTELTFNQSGTYKIKVVVTDYAGLTTIVEKEMTVFIPADVKVTPHVLNMNKGKFTVKIDLPTGYENEFDVTKVTLNGVKALSDNKGYEKMAEKGQFVFEREDFVLEDGEQVLEFRGTLSTGEVVVGKATVEVKNPQQQKSILNFLKELVEQVQEKVEQTKKEEVKENKKK